MIDWLKKKEKWLFNLINKRMKNKFLDKLMGTVTHLGGATFSLSLSLALIFSKHPEWRIVGIQCLAALSLSFFPVAFTKKMYPRLRPYLADPEAYTVKKPLTDPSFPSGHTAAAFSVAIPLASFAASFAWVFLCLAFIVAVSRIYLGLHYPSDVIAGGAIAYISAAFCIAFIS